MAKVIVTGGAGFIGSHLCDALVSLEHEVICIDNFLTSSEENIAHLRDNPRFQLIKHDVITPLPKNLQAEYVFHLASPASPNHHSAISYHTLPMETMMVNTVGTLHMLEFAHMQKAKFLFTSTSEVYGDPLEHPQKETYRGNVSTTGPRSVYDEAKRFGETLVSYFWRDKGVDARIARIFNTYGPRMNIADMRMISIFISEALVNETITVYGDGTQTRSLCYISDTVEGLIRLMFRENTKEAIVNIGSPYEHTVTEYAQMVKKLTNSSSEIVTSEELPEDDPLRRRADITKAKELLDWEPKISLEEGLQKMITFYKQA
ncbi:MAG TPA: UDP-glucuronic acid decarboxylase family protein [Candidatus Sulfotelmatobacter sp.]|jgi:UDP-glucuronate decarboxylase|nr:UDP-glucuronic acid decarboxylase family protein [Candidatus Sulfotelmatobacter sp.]